ncbi:hypothetical protein BY996DRAFT_6428993 [Phakopsora pachyrhizi]|nr:hypothetical protein BY996DRAFT_6428993 [Phakopsora pachyrhizi]
MTLLSSNTPPLGNYSAEEGRIPPVPLEVLPLIFWPSSSKEVYSNLHVLAAPTGVGPIVLRSELQKANMKVYLESCTKIEKALNNTVLYCASLPVVPKAIVHSLKKVAIKCNKRKRG